MKFTIPGPPVSPGPDQLVIRQGRIYRYPPDRNTAYRALIQRCWRSSGLTGLMGTAPLRLILTVKHQIPPSTGALEQTRMADGLHLPVRRPEAASLAEFFCEVLTGLAFSSARQIAQLEVSKVYTVSDPGVTVTLVYAGSERMGFRASIC